jgi:hypothetical protein
MRPVALNNGADNLDYGASIGMPCFLINAMCSRSVLSQDKASLPQISVGSAIYFFGTLVANLLSLVLDC